MTLDHSEDSSWQPQVSQLNTVWSRRYGSESTTLEIVGCKWRYELLVVQARMMTISDVVRWWFVVSVTNDIQPKGSSALRKSCPEMWMFINLHQYRDTNEISHDTIKAEAKSEVFKAEA